MGYDGESHEVWAGGCGEEMNGSGSAVVVCIFGSGSDARSWLENL